MNADVTQSNRPPRIRVAAIIMRDGGVLLVRHVKGGSTYWLLPGGGVEYAESLAEALEREVREETHLEVRTGPLLFVNDSVPPDLHRHVVNVYFWADILGGEPSLGADDNLAELAFVPIDALDSLVFVPDIRAYLIPVLRAAVAQGGVSSGGIPAYLGNLWKPI